MVFGVKCLLQSTFFPEINALALALKSPGLTLFYRANAICPYEILFCFATRYLILNTRYLLLDTYYTLLVSVLAEVVFIVAPFGTDFDKEFQMHFTVQEGFNFFAALDAQLFNHRAALAQ